MMKKDITVYVNSKTSMVDLHSSRLGISGENLQGNLVVKFDDEFVNGTAILEIQRNNEKYYLVMQKENESYYLPILSSLLSETTTIIMQIRITEGTDNESIPVWKSNKFYLKVEEAINAEIPIPEEYDEWIDIANAKLNEIDNIDIDVEKIGNTSTVTITKKDGQQETVQILDGEKGDTGEKGEKGDTGSIGPQGPQGPQGIQGPMGPQGKAFTISKTYSSISEMNADFNNMEVGDYVMIASSVELEDNAKLYVKGEEEWLFVSDFSGAMGIQGEQGIQGPQGPQGIQGAQGIQGIQGETGNGIATIQKTSTSGLIDTYTITYTDGNTSTFSITNGKDGEDGEVSQEQLDETNSHLDHLSKVSNLFEKITGTGTSVTLNDTSDTMLKIGLNANDLTQGDDPSPDYPQEIHVIKGNNEIKISNKNLLKITTFSDDTTTKTVNGITATIKDGKIHISGTSSAKTTFTLKKNDFTVSNRFYYYCNSINSATRLELLCKVDGATKYLNSFSAPNFQNATTSFEYTSLYVVVENGQTVNHTFTPMVVEGSTLSQYEPYKQQTYSVNLGDIELCKIGDYEDILFKNTINSPYYNVNLQLNKWYLKKNIGKVVFDGNTVFSNSTTNENFSSFFIEKNDMFINKMVFNKTIMSNYFTQMPIGDATSASKVGIASHNTLARIYVTIPTSDAPISTFMSTHNTIVYYPLATPTYTLLNDTLQTQLDNLQYALAYDTQTNISQTNTDLPFIINAETYAKIGGGGTSDYTNLTNKPKINNVELNGNKTLNDLGIQPVGNYALESEIPTKTSDLTNDSGFITGYTETDPTVPSYVKNITQANITNWNNKLDSSKVKNTMSTTAGDVYDVRYINNMIGDVETILTRLTTGSGV